MSNPDNASTPLFGQPLEPVIKAQQARGVKSDVPYVVTELILWLESHQAMTTQNIFRSLGHAPTVQQIKSDFEGGTWNPSNHPREHMHSIAAALKLYLRELPDSLVPSKYYSLALRTVRSTPDVPSQAYQLRVCVYMLPKPNKDTILFISNFLQRIAAHNRETGLDATSLASIFSPYFLRPPASNIASPHPDKVHIPVDSEDVNLVMKRFIEEAPFFFKTSQRPISSTDSTAPPTTSSVQGKALYPYAGGSKWLLPLQKDDIVDILDIKNEEGWVKVAMKGESGYTPLSYVQLTPIHPPYDDPSHRTPFPAESSVEPVPKPEPAGIKSPRLMSPELSHLALSPQMKFSSPDLSHLAHLHKLPPPPPLSATNLFPADSIPPPIDPSTLPSPLSANIPSPLSASAPPLHLPLSPHLISPRGLSNSVPSLPALPPPPLVSSPSSTSIKSNSFNNSVLPTAPACDPITAPHLLPKIQRAFSYSAPPPRLVPPQMPTPQSPDMEKTDDEETETSDYNSDTELSSEDVRAVLPPPAPALPPTLVHELITTQDTDQDSVTAKKRKERAEEVLSTERTYVKQLTVVYENYVEPLKRKEREKTPLLNATEIFAIFSNIEVILNCHRKLLETTEKRMLSWDSTPELGDIFLENTAFIKLYKYYVNNFDKSVITLKSCREKNSEFQKFAQDLDYTEKLSGLSIESFLILPVQRIPRYVLLLQDLLKYTNPAHRDFNNLSNALSFIKDLADFINSNKSDADNINKILSIQETLLNLPTEDFTLVAPRRRYIDEGGLLYKKQKAYIFLFSDVLVFTKIEKKGKRYKALINLPTASLNITDEPGVLKIISTEGTFRFAADTPKDREHWTKILRETMDTSRVEMLNSAFTDGNQTEGSNKQFMKFREEEHAAKKRNLVDRLAVSEQEYVDSIQYIRNTFLAPLRKAVDAPMPMIALSELIDITSNLETLLNCHVIFLQSIKERVAEWDGHPYVHDLFTEKTSFLKLYNYYVSNHHKSLETIDACIEKYPLFAIFLRDLEAREKVELKVLLTEPLRRVSTYYLIVQEMSMYIKPKTEEYDQMSKVVARLKEQTEKLNADLHAATTKKSDTKNKKSDKKGSRNTKTEKK